MLAELFFFLLQAGLHFGIFTYCLYQNKGLMMEIDPFIHKAPDYQQELGIGMSLLSMSYFFIIEVDNSSASSGLLVILGYKMLHLVFGLVAYFLTDISIQFSLKKHSEEKEKKASSDEAAIVRQSLMEIHKTTTLLNTSLKNYSDLMRGSDRVTSVLSDIRSQTDDAMSRTNKMNEALNISINQQNKFNDNLKRVTNEIGGDVDDIAAKVKLVNQGISDINGKLESSLEAKLEEFDVGISESLTQAANHLSSNLAAAAEHVAGTYVRDIDAVSKIFNEKIEKSKEK